MVRARIVNTIITLKIVQANPIAFQSSFSHRRADCTHLEHLSALYYRYRIPADN